MYINYDHEGLLAIQIQYFVIFLGGGDYTILSREPGVNV